MNYITKSISSQPFQIEEIKKRVLLNNVWGKITLFGNHWHLYRNENSGAGIGQNRREMEFLGKRWYLIPPYCKIHTWCTSEHPVYQFFIHFTTDQLISDPLNPAILLPDDPILDETYFEIIDCHISSNRFPFLLTKLVASACCFLPEKLHLEMQFSPEIANLLRFLSSNLEQQIGLDDMAEKSNMSKNTLLRRFHHEVGISPYQYLSNLRYTSAANMLVQTNLPLEEICEKVGIADRFHFSRMFKRLYNQPPVIYRRVHKNIAVQPITELLQKTQDPI